MNSTKKISLFKRIQLILFFLACVPITIIYLFFRDLTLLNSIFNDYINSSASFFLPFLPNYNIIFEFSTGHLIDIIIIINIIAFIERSGYEYYVNAFLKKNYLEIYAEPYILETEGTLKESSLNSNLILGLKDDSGTIINESSVEFNFYQKSRINTNQFSSKNGYCSSIIKMKQKKLNYLCNSSKKNIQHKNTASIFQKFSTNNHLPSKNNNIFSDFNDNIHRLEGR